MSAGFLLVGWAMPMGPSILLLAALLSVPTRETLEITVLGDAADPRAVAITEAVDYWNERLAAVGARVRFGEITFSDEVIADDVLRDISAGVMRGRSSRSMWSRIRPIPGDVVIAMSGADLVSAGFDWRSGGKGFVVLRRGDTYPMSLPNVPRNAVAHELGHVLGLPHDSDWSSLMCGRPAPCRPDMFRSDTPRFFPLSPEAERRLREAWTGSVLIHRPRATGARTPLTMNHTPTDSCFRRGGSCTSTTRAASPTGASRRSRSTCRKWRWSAGDVDGHVSSDGDRGVEIVEMKLEVVVVLVSDVDRAKRFYEQMGFRMDIDDAAG